MNLIGETDRDDPIQTGKWHGLSQCKRCEKGFIAIRVRYYRIENHRTRDLDLSIRHVDHGCDSLQKDDQIVLTEQRRSWNWL